MTYHSVVLGGTFDRLHRGHHSLFRKAFSIGKYVTVGLTTDKYVNKIKDPTFTKATEDGSAGRQKSKRKTQIFPYRDRKRKLEQWLNSQGWNGLYAIVPLDDAYGPTVVKKQKESSSFDAIVVSTETRKTAEKINAIRKEHGLSPLAVITIPMIPAEDFREISSTRLRNGEIDNGGRLLLPDNLRPEMKKSIGTCISEKNLAQFLKQDQGKILITVGDMTTEKFLTCGVKPHLAIIDFQMKREPFLWEKALFEALLKKSSVQEIQSGPGYISGEALRAIETWGHTYHGDTLQGRPTVLLVDGEEDLLALPVVHEAPIGAILYYGQPAVAMSDSELLAGMPKEGIIRVVVSKRNKTRAKSLLKKFIVQ